MKNKHTRSLLTLGLALIGTAGWAQTTPTGTATSTTHPVGAIAEDSSRTEKPSRSQQRAMKKAAKASRGTSQNAQGKAGSTTANGQDGQYRQSSAADGTAVNNSNSTNYNSNNVTNAPTGVGSNPTVVTNPTTVGGTTNSGGNSNVTGSATSTTNEPKTGTTRAIMGNSNGTEPANVAGSTQRTASLGDFIASSPNYVTLQNALQSTDLNEKLKQSAYTLFAPTNDAFRKLPATVQAGLLEGRNRAALTQLLSYHLVEGVVDASELDRRIKAGNGKAQLKTLAGGTLTVQAGSTGKMTLTDEQGKKAIVVGTDKIDANGGFVYGLDSVLMPDGGATSFR